MVHREINISTLLFLKLFDSVCNDCFFSDKTSIKPLRLSIHYLAFEYGLIGCFLRKETYQLVLIIDNTKSNTDKLLTNSNYYNFIERLIDSDYYNNIETFGAISTIYLDIPKEFYDDIDKCMLGKYSQVSSLFKSVMAYTYTFVNQNKSILLPKFTNETSKFIYQHNIPSKVVLNSDNLRLELSRELEVSIDLFPEAHDVWRDDRELFTEEVYTILKNNETIKDVN